eukprot:2635961-Pleurochrysis_carterae.AAC.1
MGSVHYSSELVLREESKDDRIRIAIRIDDRMRYSGRAFAPPHFCVRGNLRQSNSLPPSLSFPESLVSSHLLARAREHATADPDPTPFPRPSARRGSTCLRWRPVTRRRPTPRPRVSLLSMRSSRA